MGNLHDCYGKSDCRSDSLEGGMPGYEYNDNNL